jgi:hypothetical protein
MTFRSQKHNGSTSTTDLSSSDIGFAYVNGTTRIAQIMGSGNLLLQNGGTFTDSGERLQVTGTMKVTGLFNLITPSVTNVREILMSASVSDSSTDKFFISNGTANNGFFAPNFAGYVDTSSTLWSLAFSGLTSLSGDNSDSSNFGLLRFTAYRSTSSSDPLNGTVTAIENRKLVTFENLATAYLTFYKDRKVFADSYNMSFGTTTGTKIGTSTTQKLSFWNATPIVQPTTAIAEATFVENFGGSIVNVDSTFAGYTLQQIAQALKNTGLLS